MPPYLLGFICAIVWYFIWVGWLLYVNDFKNDDKEHGLVYQNAGCFVGYVVAMIIFYVCFKLNLVSLN